MEPSEEDWGGRSDTFQVVDVGGGGSQGFRAGEAAVTHSDGVVPASGGHGFDVCGTGATHSLPAGPTVVLGHGCCEGLGALMAPGDVLIWNPVVRSSHIFYKT